MKPSRIVLLLVAILAGGLAAYLATRGDRPVQVVQGPQVVVEEAKVRVLVAATPIGVGQRLSGETLAWQDWPRGAVRGEYVTSETMPDATTQLAGAVARFEFFPGEPIREQKLVRADQGYLSAVLPKGMRGVSIAVTAASASGGFIVPNDHVDVVLTRPGNVGQISETILHNVKVLAIGDRLGEAGTTGGQGNADNPRSEVFSKTAIATLALDPGQAETIINASRVGELSLALRSIADFAETAEAARRTSNQTVRVIRYGQEASVMAATGVGSEPAAAINPASYSEPAADGDDTAAPAADAPPPEPQVERR
ncbi:Flp pilus assembly protein CpaB [Devosia sp.]|uniref:Flp pilus assembly protein CpaB n=1 Tax=Devosia sp. TaxID=1871048 RepID=UPI002EF71590